MDPSSSARLERHVEVFSFISSIVPSQSNDYPVWKVDDQIKTSFVSKEIWEKVRIVKPVVPWHSLVWNRVAIPKHSTTTWLFMLDRNPTLNRLSSWGLDVESTCLLCGNEQESRDHLFFDCSFSNQIWVQLMHRLSLSSAPLKWEDTIAWLPSASSSAIISLAILQGWQACIYEIWRERNRRVHDGVTLPSHKVFHKILCLLINKATALRNTGSSKGQPLICLWTSGHPPRGSR